MSKSAEKGEAPGTAPGEHRFQAETSRVLDIVIHSLYSHREIFLRELISNAADAIDKLRFRAVTEHDLMGEEKELEIRIVPDAKAGTLTIEDTGVGMTREELVENLGTIARSGTRRFLEAVKEKGGGQGPELIGQFGVGFYSAFIVADTVEVTSRAAGANEVWTWSSAGRDTFRMEEGLGGRPRGTSVRLHLKADAREFLEESRLRELVRRWSDFIAFPIRLLVDPKKEEGFETVNKAGALWRRPRKDIKDEDYTEFYKHLTRDFEPPLETVHFQIEGTLAYSGLLFIPKHPPLDLFDRDRRRGVRLYVKRVFIMEDCSQLLPEHLRFVRGVVDSDDLPLNVSRELLQEDRVVRAIRKTVATKVLCALDRMAEKEPAKYAEFWAAFGAVLKEGFHFDHDEEDALAKLLRWPSTKGDLVSLDEYVKRMPAGQEQIWYALGPNRKAVEGSPHLEALVSRGHEVLLMTDPIDQWVVEEWVREFEGKRLVSAMQADVSAAEPAQDAAPAAPGIDGLTARAREVLKEEISEVRVSTRLTDSPCCLVVPEGGLHAHVERLLRAQGREVPPQKRILEINPGHPAIVRLAALESSEPAGAGVADWLRLLYDQALLAEGSPLPDPQRFARRVADLMAKSLGA